MIDRYLRERGDANIKINADLITKARFYTDPNFPDRKQAREKPERDTVLRHLGADCRTRFAIQNILLQCMQEQKLDALVIANVHRIPPETDRATGTGRKRPESDRLVADRPARIPGDHGSRGLHDAGSGTVNATRMGSRGSSVQYRQVFPVGVDFIARPFDEPMLLRIASAYEVATHRRRPPPDFSE